MRLYHTGFQTIQNPDIHYGRKNADFGQGFYLTDDMEFSKRWAKERKGVSTICNTYDLDTTGLNIKELNRDEEWFSYIYKNRNHMPDEWMDYDVIIGPIANDTIYDVMGIITSGFLSNREALKLLQIGPRYRQITIKTEKAVSNLRFITSEILTSGEISAYRQMVAKEEEEYQELFAKEMERMEE